MEKDLDNVTREEMTAVEKYLLEIMLKHEIVSEEEYKKVIVHSN